MHNIIPTTVSTFGNANYFTSSEIEANAHFSQLILLSTPFSSKIAWLWMMNDKETFIPIMLGHSQSFVLPTS